MTVPTIEELSDLVACESELEAICKAISEITKEVVAHGDRARHSVCGDSN